ncbi:colanic acid biosynthesis glycosyltransferase WcaL [Kocuria varians]|uniref:Colanic acid biosynthesis glycosyltransferase WcaL n=1 Tax=Kocuria varians TaxID=1272 RepID=A0A4Y4D7N1_KOCVA|nr:glycosyltransferase [Kocuria varians]GEC99979.1 colanic acid biosynthesis glycosyltransferase WcaL [Kocuria varians]
MRSLVVTAWFPDAQTPSRTPFVVEHCWALQEAGHDVAVVHITIGRASAPTTQETYQGIPVTRVALDVADPRSYATVERVVARGLRGAQILHTMAFSAVLFAALPWLGRRLPWVHTEHWNGVVNPASVGPVWERVAWLRHALRLPHAVTGVTGELCREMARFSRPGATHMVPCVVENPDPARDFPAAPPVRLVGVGALIDRKRPVLALETVAELVRRGMDVHYTLIGKGPLMETLRETARNLGIEDRVELTGPIPPAEVAERLSRAHLFFLPSAQENFFTAVAEAIAAGRPAAVPLSGGFDDYCTPENSVLTSSWDVPVLADAVETAWERFRHASPASIAQTVRPLFSRAEVGAQFSRIYRAVSRTADRGTPSR